MSYEQQKDEDFDYALLEKEDPQTRLGFIRKVYGILTAQLGFTAFFVVFVMNASNDFKVALFNPSLMIAVIVLYISSICALACCGFDKKVPMNYILLTIFTVCVSYIVSLSTLRYPAEIVIEAAFLTAAMTLAITVYAMTTKTDFTIFGPLMFILGFVFCVAGLLSFAFGPQMHLAYACIGVILFSFYLLIDTQMIIGGKNRKYKIDADSYILASVALYLDIINIFLYLLSILGGGRD